MDYDLKVRLIRAEFTRNLPRILDGHDPYFNSDNEFRDRLAYQRAIFGQVCEFEEAA